MKHRLRTVPVEAVPAAAFGWAALYLHGNWRWAALAAAVGFAFLLLRTDAGIRLLAATLVTALFAAGVFWEDAGWWRLAPVAAAVVAMFGARRIGAVVWPDVAILFLIGLAVVAVRDLQNEPPKVDPAPPLPPPVAVFELPGERVRKPDADLRAPVRVDLIALTPRSATGASPATHEATRFQALLLTPIRNRRVPDSIRLMIQRGDDGGSSSDLARVRFDAREFVLVPARECFLAQAREGVPAWRAEAILEGYGFSEDEARDFVDSFSGRIDFIPLRPGRSAIFRRYFSRGKIGRFLTKTVFRTPEAASDGLELPPSNEATSVQSVRVVAPTMALFGRIKGGVAHARQWIVLRTGCFDYGEGQPVPERAR